MDSATFNKHLEQLQALETDVLVSKAKDYAHGDRLSNFYSAGAFNDVDATTALWGMVTKHIIALKDFIAKYEDAEEYDEIPPAQWFEKLGDIRNYMYLLSAILYDTNPLYKEYFDASITKLWPMQTSPSTKANRERGGKVS